MAQPEGLGSWNGHSRKIYIWTYDLGLLSATTIVLELFINRFFPVEFIFVRVLLNITHINGPPGITWFVSGAGLCSAALLTPQLFIDTEFARITQTFERLEHFSEHHVLGRMAIKRFQTVTSGDCRNPLNPRYFFRTYSNRSLANDTIPDKP